MPPLTIAIGVWMPTNCPTGVLDLLSPSACMEDYGGESWQLNGFDLSEKLPIGSAIHCCFDGRDLGAKSSNVKSEPERPRVKLSLSPGVRRKKSSHFAFHRR
jgi:hypothetical protein